MTEPHKFLPYGRQNIDDADIQSVVDVLRGDWLTTGPAVERFEKAFAAAVDAPHAVSCSSGTAALHIAALAAGLGPGDRAIVPAITFLATANAVRYAGAEVVFADVDPDTALMRPSDLRDALARAGGPVKAVFPVYYAGQCGDVPAMRDIAEAAGSVVIEDACHALGASYARNGVEVAIGSGADAAMSVFSFHPVKTIAMGEGGAVTTRDALLAERLARLRNHGMTRNAEQFEQRDLAFDADGSPNPWYYEMPEPGYNYRASDIHCALGLSQLRRLGGFVAARRQLADIYDRLLAPFAPLVRPLARNANCRPAWHLYAVLIDFAAIGMTRAAFMRALRERGVGTQVHYVPVNWQPYYRKRYGDEPTPGAARFYERCLSLPLFAGMTAPDVERVVGAIGDVLARPR